MDGVLDTGGGGSYGSAVLHECKRLNKLLQPISNRYHGPLDITKSQNTLFPFVLLLGNHSSGKSSFINFLLKRRVQSTGVAPTDDNFTIIGPGEEDLDRNGPALVGDPDLGFSELRTFGSTLINHTQLKVRSNTAVKDFMIVDSPGMIDSPAASFADLSVNNKVDRGYDFESVCKWYAEKADVILLFFDPDKPGTTGETLSVFTNALMGYDHKLFIILNKADQFNKIHDFARAYGSLCWNLSKVIPRKDLPRIHTMCVPVAADSRSPTPTATPLTAAHTLSPESEPSSSSMPPVTASGSAATPRMSRAFDQGVLDLEEARHEVIREVFNAPKRRVDNEVSRLYEHTMCMHVHCRVLGQVVRGYRHALWTARWRLLGGVGVSIGLGMFMSWLFSASPSSSSASTSAPGALTAPLTPTPSSSASNANGVFSSALSQTRQFWQSLWHRHMPSLLTSSVSGALTLASSAYSYYQVYAYPRQFRSAQAYDKVFREVFAKDLQTPNDFLTSIAEKVVKALAVNVSPSMIPTLPWVEKSDLVALDRILHEDIAQLRRRASPTFPLLSPPQHFKGHSAAAREDKETGEEGKEESNSDSKLQRGDSTASLYVLAEETIANRKISQGAYEEEDEEHAILGSGEEPSNHGENVGNDELHDDEEALIESHIHHVNETAQKPAVNEDVGGEVYL